MSEQHVAVLLIEDNRAQAQFIREVLRDVKEAQFHIEHKGLLAAGLKRIAQGGIDIVLLDLGLPDSDGLSTLSSVRGRAPDVPVVVLTGMDDGEMALTAVREGAQDYVVKGQEDGAGLARSMLYAIARAQLQAKVRTMSLTDELTGLNNRRGFMTLAEQQLKVADRGGKTCLIFFADLDGMKHINDTWGHAVGDRALVTAADVLRATFRDSDIVARIGGDEFAVLAIAADPGAADSVDERLRANLQLIDGAGKLPCRLSMSLGVAVYEPAAPKTIEELLATADAAMYQEKDSKVSRAAS